MSTLKTTNSDFVKTHRDLNDKLHGFCLTKRGRETFTAAMRDHLSQSSAMSLKAINFYARIAFSEAFTAVFEAHCATNDVREVFFVTLVQQEQAFPLGEAAAFDITGCKTSMADLLSDLDFIGVVEGAYYYTAPFAQRKEPQISWHSHALVWGVSGREIAERVRASNERMIAFVPGYKAAHVRRISPATALSYCRYMTKNIVKEYTAYPKKRETIDGATGEIIVQPSGKWRNRKREIRPSGFLRAFPAFENKTLKQVTFAGGKGNPLRRGIFKRTIALLSAEAAARDARIRCRLLGSSALP
ncbi:hypothetical protein ATU3B_01995 [Agrobacterium genomosp. 3 str. CIP 111-78]|uniref:Replication protein n=1 Tax=Agrobacterium tumefaciens TaxID=358 RepID=A0AAE6BI52_AGRTU|nr:MULTISPECIES: hypothetical protein [Agrobacterium tumefaciens complex]MCA2370384.1 hypothetical protein [Agrobacterium tomkonis CIP 111-78]QCL98794.1 hypothetical protein CFBP6624_00645 [Agrobacterium tumefaciens]